MKIERSTVRKLVIRDVPRLDPVTVILEDIAPKQGKIIVECYGKSWSTYWGAMGDNTLAEFVVSCNVDYIANRMFNGQQYEPDFQGMEAKAVKHLLSERRKLFFTQREARELYDEIQSRFPDSMEEAWHSKSDLMQKLFGDDWHCAIPEVETGDYQYLKRIIETVQAALKGLADSVKPADIEKQRDMLHAALEPIILAAEKSGTDDDLSFSDLFTDEMEAAGRAALDEVAKNA